MPSQNLLTSLLLLMFAWRGGLATAGGLSTDWRQFIMKHHWWGRDCSESFGTFQNKCQIQLGLVWWISEESSRVQFITFWPLLLIWSWLVKAVYFVTKLWSVVPLAMLYLKMLPFVPWVWTEILMSFLWVGEQTQSRPYWLWMQERLLQLTRVNERGTAIDTNSLSSITLKNNSKGIWPLTPSSPLQKNFQNPTTTTSISFSSFHLFFVHA